MEILTGRIFGRLSVFEYLGKKKWRCVCICGVEKQVYGSDLRNGSTKSCGCFRKEIGYTNRKHGMEGTNFYTRWHAMKERCKPHTKSGRWHGAKGIRVCRQWEKFENFMSDMLALYLDHVEKYGVKQTTLDRIDNNGNYSPENCRWVTWKEQNANRSI